MNWLHRTRQRFNDLSKEASLEHDERQRILLLLACRDAFFALILLGLALVFFQARDGLSSASSAVLLAIMMIVPLVFMVSWRIRGGGYDRSVAAFKVATIAAGMTAVYSVVGILAWIGTLPEESAPSVANFVLLYIVIVPVVFLLGRKSTLDD